MRAITLWAGRSHAKTNINQASSVRKLALRWRQKALGLAHLQLRESVAGMHMPPPYWKLLMLISNCRAVRQAALQDASRQHEALLTADGYSKV